MGAKKPKTKPAKSSIIPDKKPLPVWKIGDIISVDEPHFRDYLLIVEVDADSRGGKYLVQPLSALRLNGINWESDPTLENPELVTADGIADYKLEC